MIKVKHFNPNSVVPYYMPCTLAALHENIKSKNSSSFLSLYPNAQLISVPVYRKSKGNQSYGFTNLWDVDKLGYAFLDKIFDFSFDIFQYPSFLEGLEGLRHFIEEQEAVLVTGTSFFTPYSDDYKNMEYLERYKEENPEIRNHVITLYGVSGEEMLVYDPVPYNYKGPLSMKDFKDFWRGDKGHPELQHREDIRGLLTYGGATITVNKEHDIPFLKEVFFKTISTIIYEYLNGSVIEDTKDNVYFFGKEALREFLTDLKEPIREKGNISSTLSNCIQEMKHGKYFLRDLLIEFHGYIDYRFIEEYKNIVSEWEKVHNLCRIYIARNKNDFSSIYLRIKELFEREYNFMSNLHHSIGNSSRLEKGSSFSEIVTSDVKYL
ncbi:hypothetical protein HPB58_12930 [Priestia filamentosa]|uniref:hypothetical protein n=1 Tax=Priestia filamentosa TaxID=1402861 RepID=UPI001FB4AF50|nr:hypothetical protein [Priestia filamentosa]UOE58261.1 hypothetical protein HPB58_12930 [Priestia filamentosa]